MTKNKDTLAKYDLGSVWTIFTGAAPLGKETAEDLQNIFPSWAIRQGYGECVQDASMSDCTLVRSH